MLWRRSPRPPYVAGLGRLEHGWVGSKRLEGACATTKPELAGAILLKIPAPKCNDLMLKDLSAPQQVTLPVGAWHSEVCYT